MTYLKKEHFIYTVCLSIQDKRSVFQDIHLKSMSIPVVAVMRRRRRLGCFIHFIVQVATVLHARNEDEDE